MTASYSRNNTKIGQVDNFSLTPLKTCSREACATCGIEGCYAVNAYEMYPSVRKAWDTNTHLALNDLATLEKDITASLAKFKPPLFRIHVGGDFVSGNYAQMWVRIGEKFPGTQFLAFTKRWDIVEGMQFPPNMRIMYSAWPGRDAPPSSRPIAWMDDGTEKRIPGGSHVCMGGHGGVTCSTCKKCWSFTGKDVVFIKH